jgi:hypothetical protein
MPAHRAFQPAFTELLRQRQLCAAIVAALGVHMALILFDMPGWPCPVRQAFNFPCPGCGLSRAAKLLLRGSWERALEVHAFAPVFLLGLIFIALSLVLPIPLRTRTFGAMEWLERRAPIVWGVAILALLYYVVRLSFFREQLYMYVL